jgi:hypothetical protein
LERRDLLLLILIRGKLLLLASHPLFNVAVPVPPIPIQPFVRDFDDGADQVIQELRPKLAAIPGLSLYMQPVQDITVDDRVSRTQFQYTLEDPNVDELHEWAPRMLARLQQLPEIRDAASDQQARGLRAQLVIDREAQALEQHLPRHGPREVEPPAYSACRRQEMINRGEIHRAKLCVA